MNTELELQKIRLQSALNSLDLVEVCDINIAKNNAVDFYKRKRAIAIDQYTETITDLTKGVLELVNIEELVA